MHSKTGFKDGPNSMVVFPMNESSDQQIEVRSAEARFQLDKDNPKHRRWNHCLMQIAQRMCEESGLSLDLIPKLEVDLVANFPGSSPQAMHTDGTMLVQASTTYLTSDAGGTHILNYEGTLILVRVSPPHPSFKHS